MTRILKALGLALGAMATMVALAAPAAQGATGTLTAGAFPAIVTGSQVMGPTFDIGAGPLKVVGCETADLNGTLAGPTDPVTLTPIYAGCISEPGAMPVTVTLNGCDYSFGVSQPGTTQQPAGTGKLEASIICPAGQRIEIHVYENAFTHAGNMPLCTYDIAGQGPVLAGIYHNVAGAPGDVLATVKAQFTAKRTGPELMCGGGGILQHLPITLTGNYTLKAFQELAGGGEGAQVPLHVGPLD
jgi:hypothetical protein